MQCYRKLYSQNTCTQAWPRMLHCVAGCSCILHIQAWLWMLHCIWLDKIAYSTHKLDPECCTVLQDAIAYSTHKHDPECCTACCRMRLRTPHTSLTQNVALCFRIRLHTPSWAATLPPRPSSCILCWAMSPWPSLCLEPPSTPTGWVSCHTSLAFPRKALSELLMMSYSAL